MSAGGGADATVIRLEANCGTSRACRIRSPVPAGKIPFFPLPVEIGLTVTVLSGASKCMSYCERQPAHTAQILAGGGGRCIRRHSQLPQPPEAEHAQLAGGQGRSGHRLSGDPLRVHLHAETIAREVWSLATAQSQINSLFNRFICGNDAGEAAPFPAHDQRAQPRACGANRRRRSFKSLCILSISRCHTGAAL